LGQSAETEIGGGMKILGMVVVGGVALVYAVLVVGAW